MDRDVISESIKKFFPKKKIDKTRSIIACSYPHFDKTDYKKVTIICVSSGTPEFVIKYPKKKSYSKTFKEEFKSLEKFSKRNQEIFPKPIGSFVHNGFFVSVEEAIKGRRFAPKKGNFVRNIKQIWNMNKKIIKNSSKKASKKLEKELFKRSKKIIDTKKNEQKVKKILKNINTIRGTIDWGYGNILIAKKGLRMVDWEFMQEIPSMYPLFDFIVSCLNKFGLEPNSENIKFWVKESGMNFGEKEMDNLMAYYLMKHSYAKKKEYLDFFRLMLFSRND